MLCLFVRAGAERVAIPAARVVEVIPAVWLHPLPGSPAWVVGAFRFRGSVTPVIDLSQANGQPAAPARLNTRIMVIEVATAGGMRKLGLLAERVAELKTLSRIESAGLCSPASLGPDLGPLVADADGMVRVPVLDRIVPDAFQDLLFGGRIP